MVDDGAFTSEERRKGSAELTVPERIPRKKCSVREKSRS
jgi:hypothetical protein